MKKPRRIKKRTYAGTGANAKVRKVPMPRLTHMARARLV